MITVVKHLSEMMVWLKEKTRSPALGKFFEPGLANAYWFATFNALSFQIVLGSPMVLYAKSLGATATVLGIIAGMMPLLVIFQIPAAKHISRIGYRRFVFAGWGIRVLIIFLIATVPLTSGFLEPQSRIALLLLLLFGFNLSRGISSAAWLPWITALVPPEVRGQYLARDSACVNGASAMTLAFSGFVLGQNPDPWQFSAIFAFSAVMGVVSLTFLKRIPDVPGPELLVKSGTQVPWLEIARYRPFRKLLRFNVAWAIAYGGLGAFSVAYLKASANMSEGTILLVTAVSYAGGLGGLALFGARLDSHGSKPVLTVCVLGWLVILAGWIALSGQVLFPRPGYVLALELFMGLGYAVYSMANTRLAMAVIPPMGRDHFFALFSVVSSLTLGLAPIFWGMVIDAFGSRAIGIAGFNLNRFSLFFLLAMLAYVSTAWFCYKLEEPRATNVQELLRDMLAQTPIRSWIRFWPRG